MLVRWQACRREPGGPLDSSLRTSPTVVKSASRSVSSVMASHTKSELMAATDQDMTCGVGGWREKGAAAGLGEGRWVAGGGDQQAS